MNSDIEKYEKKKLNRLKTTNPLQYQKEIMKSKERNGEIDEEEMSKEEKSLLIRYQYGVVIFLCLINSFLGGPPILYLLFALGPTIIKKLFP